MVTQLQARELAIDDDIVRAWLLGQIVVEEHRGLELLPIGHGWGAPGPRRNFFVSLLG